VADADNATPYGYAAIGHIWAVLPLSATTGSAARGAGSRLTELGRLWTRLPATGWFVADADNATPYGAAAIGHNRAALSPSATTTWPRPQPRGPGHNRAVLS
jgi:hypothetical protein